MANSLFALAVAGAAAAGAAAGACASYLALRARAPPRAESAPIGVPLGADADADAGAGPKRRGRGVNAPFGLPTRSSVERELEGFSVGYDQRLRMATWAYERLTPASVEGEAKRKNVFEEDARLASVFRARLQDYRGSGMDRGHLVPAGDLRDSQAGMDASFMLSNIAPQDPTLNRGYWKRLEDWVRGLTMLFDEVHVITGPLFVPQRSPDGESWETSYKVIGHNHQEVVGKSSGAQDALVHAPTLPIPTHFYKIVLARKSAILWPFIAAFIVPNRAVDENEPLQSFVAPVGLVESLSGHLFFPKLLHRQDKHAPGPAAPKDLCGEVSCNFVTRAMRKSMKRHAASAPPAASDHAAAAEATAAVPVAAR
ncbi:Mitochondrial nuclease [Hondaea fermentalgiana]|uniref:Endonuclease n=1 Tax=Hondaea fermentalgiana TaxID=2315210 RepID=A0A2R5GFP4_9STRA|nr:Mitochondrial nuclease [Hondaea fermentalgiana]|eukprot:GBG26684.1 Mitochondrial nuclease [Hondaea fermentalgiana]